DGSVVATKENVDPLGCLEYARPPPSKKYCLESVQCKKVPSMLTACNSSLTLSTARLKQLEVTKVCPSGVQNYESSSVPLHSAPDASDIQPVLFISPLAKHPTDEVVCSGDLSRNKKRVRFGAPLSPEFFDKNLPPSTPLQKGGTPAHASTSAGPQLRPLLKTPQRSTSHFPQPDFTSPVMGDLPTSSEGPGCAEAQFDPGEHQDENGQEMTLPVATEKTYDKILTSTDMASQVCIDSNVQCTSEPLETHPSPLHDSLSGIETETVPPCALEPLLCTAAPAAVPTCSRKRKASTNVVVKKRTSRNAAISAAKKLCKKSSSGKKRWGNKEVDRSLYGKRDYASKNPALSPITEALSSASRSPTPQRHHSGNRLLASEGELMASVDEKTIPNKKSGAQGRVRGRRSSRVQPSLILDEAVVLGTQVDASAAELVNSVEPKGPEDPNVLGREMRKEGLLAQGCDLEKSAGKTEKSSSSVDQVPCGNCSLPEWAQFSIEDVLQPLPRTQRCVRRSLRN
ncbi:hypothetical protein Z043_112423, partial [Scleropages formosus]